MSSGTTTTTTQAPSVNLEIRKTMVARAVTTAPMPLSAAFRRQPGGRAALQCTTMPVWARVKPMNTPMANRGINVLVFPRTTTNSAAAAILRAQMPLEKTRRSPRRAKAWGR